MRLLIGCLGDTSVLRSHRVLLFGTFGIFAGSVLLSVRYMNSYTHMMIGAVIFGLCGGDKCIA